MKIILCFLVVLTTIICSYGKNFIDDFNYGNQTTLHDSIPFTKHAMSSFDMAIYNGTLKASNGNATVVYDTATDTYNQYLKIKITADNQPTQYINLYVRCPHDSVDGYNLSWNPAVDSLSIRLIDNNVASFLQRYYIGHNLYINDSLRIEANGDSIHGYYNADKVLSVYNTVNQSSGKYVAIFDANGYAVDNFIAGDLPAACDTPIIIHAEVATCTTRTLFKYGSSSITNAFDSIKLVNPPVGVTMVDYTTKDSVQCILQFATSTPYQITRQWYACGDSGLVMDTLLQVIWDPVRYDSTVDNSGTRIHNGDTLYYYDSTALHGYWAGITGFTITIDDHICAKTDSTDTTLGFIIASGITPDFYKIRIFDTGPSADTSDSFYVAGLYDTATITFNPHDTTVGNAELVNFYVSATSSGTLTYQWQFYQGVAWADTAGAIDTVVSFTAYTARSGDSVRCIVTSPRGGDTTTAALLTVTTPIYALTITNDGHGTTDPSGAVAVGANVGTAIVATSNVGYGFVNWTVISGTVTFANANDSATACTTFTDATIRANFDIDTFYCISNGDANAVISYLPDSIGAYAEYVWVKVTVSSGYVATWVGGDTVSGSDSVEILMLKDTTITAVSYAIPVLDSIISHPRRDSLKNVARQLDTLFYHGSNFADSAAGIEFWLNSTGTETCVITGWSTTLVKAIVPTGSVRGYRRSRIKTKDGVMSANPTSNNLYIKVPFR